MAAITLSNPTFYNGGASGASAVVGVSSGLNRVARYSFTSPDIGASSVTLKFTSMWFETGVPKPASLYFYIGTDPNSHINAGAESTYTGVLNVDTNTYTSCSGSADVLLLPNTTYYLFVFPATTTFGWYYWQTTAAMTSSGGAGLVYIDNGSGFDAYQIYIDNGTSWDLHMPYIDNGSGWDLYT